MHDFIRILLIAGVCNLIAVGEGLIYGRLVLTALQAEPWAQRAVYIWAFSSLIGCYVVVIPMWLWLTRPLSRARAALAGGPPIAPAEMEKAQRRALNLPVSLSRMSTALWIICAFTFPLYHAARRLPGTELDVLHVVMVTILTGTIAGPFIFYLAERYVRRELIPALIPDGRPSRVKGGRAVPLSFKLTILLFSCGVMPIAVLTFAAVTGSLTPTAIMFLGGSFIVLGVLQVLAISDSVTRPVQELASEMGKVSRADLSASSPAVSLDHIGQLAEGFNDMVTSLKRAEFVKDTFGRYVTRQVLDEILNGKVQLGGELRRATVLFSDIRGFTSLSENLPPGEVVRFLNRYLDIMVDVIIEQRGTIDKFIGDAIMASFGVPLSAGGEADDALRAVRAALGMISRLEAWNRERQAAGEQPIDIGIGLHTGDVVAGNIGSTKKMEYTVIGDTVNTSSRIEQLNKHFGTRLLVSAETHALVAGQVVARELDPIEVKGKALPLRLYEVKALTATAKQEELKR
jgi:class 3 adenylate cyclase